MSSKTISIPTTGLNRVSKNIKINNQSINDQNIIAQKFNEYFVGILPNIAEKIDLV